MTAMMGIVGTDMIDAQRVLILANGDSPSAALLQRLVAAHDLLIATDGAAPKAALRGVAPDIICGDFDSLSCDLARQKFPRAEIVPTPDQNQGDLEKALGVARERGAREITITGATGGRLDHTLGNIALLLRYHAEIALAIRDECSETRAISGEWKITATPGDLVSVISFDGLAHVTLTGVQWPLQNHRMPIGTLGISNRAVAPQVTVRVQGGTVIACHTAGYSR
jgi:thiamine pyrophosphokinase